MTGTTDTRKREQAHEIASLRSLAIASAQSLRSRWITTVEQLVASAATAQGRKGLESLLGESPDAIDKLLNEARVLLGCERYEILMHAKQGGALGARFDDPAFNPGGSKGGQA
jgi:hypothetical protein